MERIDTHCHIVPSGWRKWCDKHGWDKPDGMPGIPEWSPQAHIALMDKLNIKRSILSITSPGTHLKVGDFHLARQVTRETNNEIAEAHRRFPDKFSFFASLPLPDVDGSVQEIDRVRDMEGCCGFTMMTNAEGYYLGDEIYRPVFEKLNERPTVIFIHPTQCCSKDLTAADKPLAQYPTPMIEYYFDTTRAVVNLLLTQTVPKYPNLTFLVSHCGATLPPLVERVAAFSTGFLEGDTKLSSTDIKELLRTRFYFDLAGFPFPDLIHGYLRIGDASRLLYGSDYPYTPGTVVESLSKVMDKNVAELFKQDTVESIYSGNAKRLFGF
ncbi:hypothetical protein BDV38DRAFT_289647 [Aspergillus pseudotamarii]|uniref:6-methylsalicylate decarboxylase n=1 Tax=Aspergillus pseudotamarii TaxID=132259 RepID=A0A5N6TBW6_ASPPS|nr:uncharacterized protein BDV38DRAFT_289647 [Aspergillus pseudotamarii]KAE8143796.1 hypothetical protein BDV38DRAFT_289647 [Aspergillus pseudotamarii]